MSKSLNKVTLIGHLGGDPEVRGTNGGTKVATLSLATGRQWTGANGEKQEKTEWHKLVVWGNKQGDGLAGVAEKYCKKGDRIYIEGRIEYRTYEKDGQTKYITEINVTDLLLLGGSGERPAASSRPAATPNGGAETPDGGFGDDDDLPF